MPSRTKQAYNHPHTKTDISTLLLLEENMEKGFDNNLSMRLLEIYTKLIEYYDTSQDPIQLYFKDKMQQVILRMKRISKSGKEKSKKKYVPKFNREFKTTVLDQKRVSKKSSLKEDIDQLMKKRKQKLGKEIDLDRKLEEMQRSQINQPSQTFKDFTKKEEKNSQILDKQLDIQSSSIQERLIRRKLKSFSDSFGSFLSNGKGTVFSMKGDKTTDSKDKTKKTLTNSPPKLNLYGLYSQKHLNSNGKDRD